MDLTNPKVRLILAITCLVVFFIGAGLCIYWYGWKLFLVLFILQFSWNLDNALKNSRNQRPER